ncbi:MAG: FAD-binding protein [Geminicoccaceae bacterium]
MSEERAEYRPTSSAELEQLVAWAVAEERRIEIAGQGSKRGLGRPVEADIGLRLDGLSGILLYEPEELVMSAAAGTPLAEIEAALAERGQELAFDPADYGAICGGPSGLQTIGGVFACNVSGSRRLKAGAARDHLLGLNCITGYGQSIKTGGRVVKNVTGYDLCKLLAGSFGTLAVMDRVTFKVMPKAESERTLILSGKEEPELLAILRMATGTSAEVSGAACLPMLAAGRSSVRVLVKPARTVALIRLEGPRPSVAYRAEQLIRLFPEGVETKSVDDAESARLWREVRDVTLLTKQRPLWRLSLAPTHAAELVGWLRELTDERIYDWAGGLVWLAMRPDWAESADVIREALVGRGGHATLVRGSPELRSRIEVFQPQPEPLRKLSARVKASFDPKNLLNPGRMVPA